MLKRSLLNLLIVVIAPSGVAFAQQGPRVVLGDPLLPATSTPAGIASVDSGCSPKSNLGCTVPSRTAKIVISPARLPCESECGWGCGTPGHLWVSAEYLMWWTNGARLPAMLASSPDGTPQTQAGVLGAPGTRILAGNSVINNGIRPGFRIKAGTWLDDDRTCGIEASYFQLGNQSRSFQAGAIDGTQIVSRPFFNAATNQQDAELVSFPGIVGGSATVTTRSSGLLGAGAMLRSNLCCGNLDVCWGRDLCEKQSASVRFDALLGYRYYGFDEQLGIVEQLTPLGNQFIPGTQLTVTDQFTVRNTFNGLLLGVAGEWYVNRWSLTAQPRVAIGQNFRQVTIDGSTVVTTPGFDPVVRRGGLFALSSNIGTYRSVDWTVIPELDLTVGYRLTQRLRCTLGYSMIYWSNIARANSQVDSVVNGNLIPSAGGVAGGPQRPAYAEAIDNLWMHGLNFGIEYRY